MKNATASKKTCKFTNNQKVSRCKIMLNSYLLAFAQLKDPRIIKPLLWSSLLSITSLILFLVLGTSAVDWFFESLSENSTAWMGDWGEWIKTPPRFCFLFFTRPFLFFVWCGPCGYIRSFPRWNYRSGSRQALPGDQVTTTPSDDALDDLIHAVRSNKPLRDIDHVSFLSSRVVFPSYWTYSADMDQRHDAGKRILSFDRGKDALNPQSK